MKKVIQFLFILSISVFFKNLNAQSQFYTEQNSGVTSNLTSVTMEGIYLPSQVWVCGDGGVVLKSTNLGANWLNGSSGIPSNLNLTAISCKAVDTVLAAGNIGTTTYVYRTANGGTSWSQVFTQPNGRINAVWMKNASLGFMAGNPVGARWSLWKTTNGGVSWDSSGMNLPQTGTETGWNNSLAIMNNNIWFGTNNSRIYKSSNFGLSWNYVSTPEVRSTAIWIFWDTTSYTFAYSGGGNVYYTTNGGINWTQGVCPDTASFKGFCPAYYGVESFPPMGSYAVRSYNKVYFNFGGSIFNAEYTAPSGIYNHMAYDVNMMYWEYTWAVRSNGGITRIALFRGGAIRKISSEIPKDYNLHQNYPNPFNPNTKIKFEIRPPLSPLLGKEGTGVVLNIFDILGREVATLVNEKLSPGIYEVEFDGTNYSSGVYFYRIEAGNFTSMKKMVLLK